MNTSFDVLKRLIASIIVASITALILVAYCFLRGGNTSWLIALSCFAVLATSAYLAHGSYVILRNHIKRFDDLFFGLLLPYGTPLLPGSGKNTSDPLCNDGLLIALMRHFIEPGSLDLRYSRDRFLDLLSDARALLRILTKKQ